MRQIPSISMRTRQQGLPCEIKRGHRLFPSHGWELSQKLVHCSRDLCNDEGWTGVYRYEEESTAMGRRMIRRSEPLTILAPPRSGAR